MPQIIPHSVLLTKNKPTLAGAAILIGMCGLTYFLPGQPYLLLAPLFLVAAHSTLGAAIALVLCWLPASLGGALFPWISIGRSLGADEITQAMRWLLMIFCLSRTLVMSGERYKSLSHQLTQFIVIYGLLLTMHALLISHDPVISTLKTLSWAIGTIAILKTFQSLRQQDVLWLLRFLLGILVTAVVVSLTVRSFPGALLTRQGLLRGVFGHSQVLGGVASGLATFLICHLLLKAQSRARLQTIAITVLSLVAIALCSSRTAFFSTIIGIVGGTILHGGKGRFQINRLAAVYCCGLLSIAGAIVVISDSGTFDSIFYKHGIRGSAVDSLLSTRQPLIDKQLADFSDHPLLGIGFGVSSPVNFRELVTQFRWSAPTEKGFLPTAVLQETGLIGFVLFAVLLATMIRLLAASADPRLIGAATCGLASNIGEATLYSLGGIGILTWLWFALALSAPANIDEL